MLEVQNVRKMFSGQEVLKGIDLKVNKGDVVAIIGPSGSGKTTLLRCINFLEKADAGTMYFGDEVFDMAAIKKADVHRIRRRTGFVFQGFNLFANKTALKNVTEGLIVAREMHRDKAEQIAREALERVGMLEKADAYPSQLSGGQQQRVAIARALALSPAIIYFDEPTSALDPELIGEVLNVMRALAESGMTMLVVTHEMSFARNVSSHVIFMENGQVVERAPSAEFFSSPHAERTRAFLQGLSSC